mmetsp:Transcript_49848/g.57539  ORF Transcript_49848/g.57539 Transcript_49848/m.57539 type:complete len:317 (+) Transcript_49848:67-1017(+)
MIGTISARYYHRSKGVFFRMIWRQQQTESSPVRARITSHSTTSPLTNNNKFIERTERPRRYYNLVSTNTKIYRNRSVALFSTENYDYDSNKDSTKEGKNYIIEEKDHQEDDVDYQQESQLPSGANPSLASIISQGSKLLEQTAEDIQHVTRKDTLSQPHKKPSYRNSDAAEIEPRQLAEGQRILDVALDCIDQLALQYEERGGGGRQPNSINNNNNNGLILFGEPIVLLECEVNRTMKQAKIYWTLPYGLLLDKRINQKLYQQIIVKIQAQLVDNGGAKLLTKLVHNQLSYYYPPRTKLFPATDDMVEKAIKELMV